MPQSFDCYAGEIRLCANAHRGAPVGWHYCDGALLPVNTYQVLFTLLGTTYGGDGVTTFGLPDYRSRLPIGMGAEGVNNYPLGAWGGFETVQLGVANMPIHTHPWTVSTTNATVLTANGSLFGTVPEAMISGKVAGDLYIDGSSSSFATFDMDPAMIGASGTTATNHENRMPTMAICFIIALNGIYPVRG